MEQRPVAQGTGGGNNIVNVYGDRLELKSGWQGQNTEQIPLREVVAVRVKGLISSTLTIETNGGRILTVKGLAPPDARQIKSAVERQKRTAGLYE